ncbi:hypothetical protein OG429_13415 [Streptomyces sp. NBC_00190]|uniref:hypothetical protein n=1 Tax=Streptomyces sp. NBC_00190 TaxID=2903634 RepID=UPI002E2851DB|nr:hypothetical protein [Streptomyces sp. NBC_00190]
MTGPRQTTDTHVTDHAPCFGDGDFSPAADRWDDISGLRDICDPILHVCGRCPFRAACILQVNPAKAAFDGVCGGRIWNDGTILAAVDGADDSELLPPVSRQSCGSKQGVRAHRRAAERMCTKCDNHLNRHEQLALVLDEAS